MIAWRPSHAFEMRDFSASASSSRCSSDERLTETRCFEGMPGRGYKGVKGCMVQHFRVLSQQCLRVNWPIAAARKHWDRLMALLELRTSWWRGLFDGRRVY